MVKKVNGQEFENEAMKASMAVVDFSATWCGPCRMLAPVVEELSEKLGDKVSFFNVDVDEAGELAMEYRISSVPCLVLMKNGDFLIIFIHHQGVIKVGNVLFPGGTFIDQQFMVDTGHAAQLIIIPPKHLLVIHGIVHLLVGISVRINKTDIIAGCADLLDVSTVRLLNFCAHACA